MRPDGTAPGPIARRDDENGAATAVPRLKKAAGSDSDRLNGMLLRAVLGCLPHPAAGAPEDRERRIGGALDAARGFGPRGAAQGMLAAQAAAMQLAGMAALQRSQRPDLPSEVASRLRRDGVGLCRGVAEMAGAIGASGAGARGRWCGWSAWWCRRAGRRSSAPWLRRALASAAAAAGRGRGRKGGDA